MGKEEMLECLASVGQEAERRYKARIRGVFGSYARGDARAESDIDVLVEFGEGADLFDLVGLGDFLEDALKRKVDVVSQRALRAEIAPDLLKDMVYL